MRIAPGLAFALLAPFASAQTIDLQRAKLVDLTHSFNTETLYWPTSPSGFELKQLAHGHTEGGFFYSANSFCAPEHGGTHLDAPIHFAESRQSAEAIPLQRLMAAAYVIDVRERVREDADYALSAADLAAFEAQHGAIKPGSMVLLNTGYARHYGDRKKYFGDDTPNDASKLHFPSFGEQAARTLVEDRGVVLLGVDTPSIDIGQSRDFKVHRIAAARNVPGLENLNGLDALPATGAVVIALPMKIEGGSGGPVRVVAILP